MSDPNAGLAAAAPTTVDGGELLPPAPDPGASGKRARSLSQDAFADLIRRPMFWFAAALILLFVLMALFPSLFTSKDPNACDLSLSRQPPGTNGAIFGYDLQGCDVYSRAIYGARASIIVGVVTTLLTMGIGIVIGTTSGYFGKWIDAILSRITDIFFAIPLLLGAILILTAFPKTSQATAWVETMKVVLALTVLGWTSMTRIMRASVIQVRNADFVVAARALGAGNWRIIRRHVLPNSLTALIVVATISLGGFIGAEATLSFLGIGLQPPVISWGQMINEAAKYIRVAPHMLFFPSLFLSLTVLAFIMLGDVVRDAFDPKLR